MKHARKGLFRSGHHDENHGRIMARFAQFGPEPIDTTKVGGGFPDAVWPFQGLTVLIEVKTPEGTMTPAQARFSMEWRGGPVYVVTTEDDVPEVIADLRRNWLPKSRKVLG